MHLGKEKLAWLENRLDPAQARQAAAHLADCPACRADAAETRELVDVLSALPQALEGLPWRRERLWPAVRQGLLGPAPAARAWRWATVISLVLLVGLFSGIWAGGGEAAPPASGAQLVRPLGPALGPAVRVETVYPYAAVPAGQQTATPLPAPAQTPAASGLVQTETAAPGG